jgi:hypothetical protein
MLGKSACVLALVMGSLCGCEPPALSDVPTQAGPQRPGTQFDAATAGSVDVRIVWDGPRPAVPCIREPLATPDGIRIVDIPNPNDPTHVVVHLIGIEPARAKPWPWPPVHVDVTDEAIQIANSATPRVGLVQLGDRITMQSRSKIVRGVRARGAAFFSRMLPDMGRAEFALTTPGRVSLTSPASIYWAAAELFVCEHPYFAITDDTGHARIADIPAGAYEVVAVAPNWHTIGHDRDPESGAVIRRFTAPPIERRTSLNIQPRQTSSASITFRAADFTPIKPTP